MPSNNNSNSWSFDFGLSNFFLEKANRASSPFVLTILTVFEHSPYLRCSLADFFFTFSKTLVWTFK
ncbi:hypothetical protein LEP1GSC133_4422 [Leptospira borgpetersenii serovar Pomona str. 200901868]|uniref:Uncharacterized protein n=1 Tax=Leptospira borgpetersenii serovar Pomona str. 200901868 TaxID=1192866 RepID=M6VZU7_LEPBO|nr:hypothetical protein LEP1GSC133_4422 [Leptospira borgpetersenii serovar Pomona str. 200901868]